MGSNSEEQRVMGTVTGCSSLREKWRRLTSACSGCVVAVSSIGDVLLSVMGVLLLGSP